MANRGCYNSDLRKGLAIIIFVVSLLFFNHCNANDLNYAHESSLFKIKYSDYKAWLSKDGLDTSWMGNYDVIRRIEECGLQTDDNGLIYLNLNKSIVALNENGKIVKRVAKSVYDNEDKYYVGSDGSICVRSPYDSKDIYYYNANGKLVSKLSGFKSSGDVYFQNGYLLNYYEKYFFNIDKTYLTFDLWANTDAVNNALEYLKFSIPGASSHDNIVREINEVLFVDKNLDIYIKRTLLQKNKKSEESLTDVDDIYELIKFNT